MSKIAGLACTEVLYKALFKIKTFIRGGMQNDICS